MSITKQHSLTQNLYPLYNPEENIMQDRNKKPALALKLKNPLSIQNLYQSPDLQDYNEENLRLTCRKS